MIAEVERAQGSISINASDANKDDFKATLTTLESVKNKLNTYTTEQIVNLETLVAEYISELTDYNTNYAKYQKFIEDLKKYGLYDETVDVNPDKLAQKLIFGEETNAKVEADLLGHDYVKFDDFDRWGLKYDQDKMKFLNHFCRITQDNVDGNIFKLIYTGLSNTSYNDEKITKIELTFSDWEFSDNYAANQGKPAGIYFHDDPSKGFWYVNTKGVTMDMVLYAGEGDNEHVVTLADDAYVVLNSMNSEGAGQNYIEKAQIINGVDADDTEYGGKGVPLPESAVNIHDGSESNVTGGGDILYADQNINMIAKPGTLSAEAEANVKAYWGEDKGQFIIDNYLGWDATPADEADYGKNTKKIFATGMFQVHGNRVKIRYSNDVNAGWSTYSSELPSLTFKAEKPTIAPLTYTPGEIVLETSDVTIHYIDVNGVNKPNADITHEDGTELKFQNFDNLFIDGKYSINGLWDYASAGYKLVKQDDLANVVITKDHKGLYIYLTHDTTAEEEKSTVTQNIKYVYGGETETPVEEGKHDVTRYLYFTRTVEKDKTDPNIIVNYGTWIAVDENGNEITGGFEFAAKDSPVIPWYSPDKDNIPLHAVTDEEIANKATINEKVVYTKNATTPVEEKSTVTQNIKYVYGGETETPVEEGKQDVTRYLYFIRTGEKDSKNESLINWSAWKAVDENGNEITGGFEFAAKDSPVIPWYSPDKDNIPLHAVTDEEIANKATINEKVVYHRNNTTPDQRDYYVDRVIHYVYDEASGGGKAAEDKVVTLRFTQAGERDSVNTDLVNWNGVWTAKTTDTFEVVTSPKIDWFTPDKAEVGAETVTVTNEDRAKGERRTIEETVVYHRSEVTTSQEHKHITQNIVYVYDDETSVNDGQHDKHTTLHFTRDVKQSKDDPSLFEYGTWVLEGGGEFKFAHVGSPKIDWYTPDRDSIDEYLVNVDEIPETSEINEKIVYRKNATTPVEEKKTVTQNIKYVYGGETETPVEDGKYDVTRYLHFIRTGEKDSKNENLINWGEWKAVDENGNEITDGFEFAAKDSPDIPWYSPNRKTVSVHKVEESEITSETVINEKVIYTANPTETVTRDKTVTETIHYVYEDGTMAHPDKVVTHIFTQHGIRDTKNTNLIIWESKWTETKTFETVVSPIIDGYTADKKEIEAYNVTVNNGNFDEKQDEEFTVTYTKNPVTPGPDDPTPDTPTPDPTPDDDEEIATPPLPEDEIGNYPSQSDEDNEEERTAPHAIGKETRSGTNKNNARVISLENAVSDDSVTPENVSTEATDKTDEKQATVNSTNEKTLPATGEEKDDFAKVMSGLAAALGITGLAVTSKRRKATAKRSKKDKKER